MFENDNQLMAHLSGYDQSRSRLETILGVRPPLFCALWSLSFSPLIFSVLVPIFIGKMTDSLRHGGLGFSESQAGIISTVEMLSIAVAGSVAPYIWKGKWRNLALLCGSVAIFATAASVFAQTFWSLLGLRTLAGIALGFCMAAGSAGITQVRDPERVYSLIVVMNAFLSAICLGLLGVISDAQGMSGSYLFFALLLMLAWPFSVMLRLDGPVIQHSEHDDLSSLPWFAWLGIGVVALLNLSTSALYTMADNIARTAGFEGAWVGAVIGLGPALGAVIAIMMSMSFAERYRFRILVALFFLSSISSIIMGAARSPQEFAVSYLIFEMSFWGILPLLLGFVVRLGKSETVNALQSAAMIYGSALAPIGTAMLYDASGNAKSIGILCGAAQLTNIGILLLVKKTSDARLTEIK